jgi:drug/metabolite transporter (DMT)-like permease
MGILLAVTALFSWGLGDFLIQRGTRRFGDWITLFYITAFGAIVLFPFVYKDLGNAFGSHAILLWIASFVMLGAALFDFQALKVGKISVAEPILAFEIPVAALLAAYVIREHLSFLQTGFVVALIAGIFLVSTRSLENLKRIHLEKGIWWAVAATVFMGAADFSLGLGSRATNPLVANWVMNIFIAAVTLAYIAGTSQLPEITKDFRSSKRLILNVCFFDNLAWVAFSYACIFIPIAIATGISEGFIAFAGGLGLLFNKEKLKRHQWIGFFLAAVSVIVLAFITDR